MGSWAITLGSAIVLKFHTRMSYPNAKSSFWTRAILIKVDLNLVTMPGNRQESLYEF
jgi:hypothetical protein